MTAVVILGMHRSGTSCLAGMLAAGGLASPGEAVRNWDNARGHHERLEVVRLNEAVLAHSGGHWLAPPPEVRWTPAHAGARDRLLAMTIEDRPVLLKDPRTLLVLPFWRASPVAFRALGIVRHPLAVARSLEAWRELPLAEGIALWIAHNAALAADREAYRYPVIDFDRPKAELVSAVLEAVPGVADRAALAEAYEEQLVHHDESEAPELPGLAAALASHRALVEVAARAPRPARASTDLPRFPRARFAAFQRALEGGALDAALAEVRSALVEIPDGAAVLVPVVTALIRRRALAAAVALIEEQAARVEADLASLLLGKVLLAMSRPVEAVPYLERACAVERPYFQARQLLAQALRAAGRTGDARALIVQLAGESLYPHGPLSTLAEWSWLDGDRDGALSEMAIAIEAAPLHRRGRLRTRRAEWLIATGDRVGARHELERAIDDDPGFARSREVLATLP